MPGDVGYTIPKQGYARYIASRRWKQKRRRTAKGACCQACERVGPVDVHHRTYSTLGVERGWELVALCRRCHLEVHRRHRADTARALWYHTDDVIYAERGVPFAERWWHTAPGDPEEGDPDQT